MRLADAAIVDQRQALAFRVLEVEGGAAVAGDNVADGNAVRRQPLPPPAERGLAINAQAGAGDGIKMRAYRDDNLTAASSPRNSGLGAPSPPNTAMDCDVPPNA